MLFLIFCGVSLHIIFLVSIFDIYFTSPILNGMTPHFPSQSPPAKRLILFVADGLRADSLYRLDQHGVSKAPFLRSIIEKKGVWGVSSTQVPTESRPGHVAIISGFYEDVSAITKGWKENPVEFDSVFNQSRYTWSWGSPDILPMFTKGASGSHVFMEMYDASQQDFAGENSTIVDTWVFNKIKDFFKRAKTDYNLHKMLKEDKIVFFIHLLGLDIAGHGLKPHSQEYAINLQVVDEGIGQFVQMLEDFYQQDGNTAYIFTSDHGMTDWGSHGTGLPSEIETPFIAWGAGIKKPQQVINFIPKTNDWNLHNFLQSNISQIDIASLMSILIGIPIPLNSRGILPYSILQNSDEFVYHSMLLNCLQLASQIEIAELQRRTKTFIYFKKFGNTDYKGNLYYLAALKYQAKEIRLAISHLHDLMILMNEELSYLHTYDRLYLKIFISFGFIGWLAYTITEILQHHTVFKFNSSYTYSGFHTYIIGIFIVFIVSSSLLATHSSLMYYIYSLVPVILWTRILSNFQYYRDIWLHLKHNSLKRIIFLSICGFIALETLVLTMFIREVLSLGLICMAFFPFTTSLIKTDKNILVGWLLSCLCMALFPFMPVIGKESNYNLVSMAGWITLAIGGYCVRRRESTFMKLRKSEMKPSWNLTLTLIQLAAVLISIFIVKTTVSSVNDKTGLPLVNQFCSWIILVASLCLPMMGPKIILPRLLNIALSLMAPYILLSISHEALFCINLLILMFFWIKIEHKLSPRKQFNLHDLSFSENLLIGSNRQQILELHDIRRAYFFLYFLMTSFFGTGNIASLNSFDPTSVFCFLTVFNPFVMGALILFKMLIPFIFVACAFQAIQVILSVTTTALFLTVLGMSDFMALHFFFLVQDSGSWLDIGTSISHYVIMITLTIVILLLYGLSKLLTAFNLPLTGRKAHAQ